MKKAKLPILGLTIGMLTLFSCMREGKGDNVPDGGLSVSYSVQVVPVGDVSKGLAGATVVIQSHGETRTADVDANGIAVFDDIKPGNISGYVSAAGYTSINYTANIAKSNIDADTKDFAASTIYMIAKNSGLAGTVYGDYNNDATADPTDGNDQQTVTMNVTYSTATYPPGAGNGFLTSVSLDVATYSVTSDASGKFTFSSIPTTANGYLTATYWMEDIVDPDDNVTGLVNIFNIPATPVALQPDATTQLGQIQAN